MTDFIAGFLAGCFSIVAIGSALAGWACCAVGGRYDESLGYDDPEAK